MGIRKILYRYLPVLIALLMGLLIALFLPSYRFLAVVLALLAGAYGLHLALRDLRKHNRKAGNCLLAVFYILLIAGLTLCTWASILIGTAAKGDPQTPCGYIIVLGAGVNGTRPSQSLQWRIDAAYDYLTAHPETQCIVSGGKGSNENISEAQCMYDHLTAKGIDGSRIWLEENSTSTRENIRFSLDLVQEKTGIRPKTAGILSSEYHLYRAGLLAKQEGLYVAGIPAKTKRPSLFVTYFIREIFAVMYYTVFG